MDTDRIGAINIILDELRNYETEVLMDIASNLVEGCYLTTDYT